MTEPVRARRPGAVALAVAVVLGALAPWAFPTVAGAHTPHDDVSDVAMSPTFARDGRVYVIAGSRLFVSEAGDYHWKPLVRGLPRAPEEGKTLARIAIASSSPETMYVSSRVGGVFRSDDGGRAFHQVVGNLASSDISAIAVSPRSPDTVLAGGSIQGFFRTADGGRSWTTVPGIARVPAVMFVPQTGRAVVGDGAGRIRISDDGGATWTLASPGAGASISALAASTGAAPPTVFAGDTAGHLLRSTDGGSSFSPIASGLPTDQISGLATSPDYDRDHTVWASLANHGVYRSTDRGQTWTRTSRGLSTDIQAHVVKVAEFRGISAAAGAHGTELYQAGFDGLFHSEDGGATWTESQTLVDFVTGLDVSPEYAHDRTVAAATYVKGAYLSTDSGTRWSPIDHGLYEKPGAGNKYATIRRLHNITFSPDYGNDHTLFSAGWTAFLRSTDAGASWQPILVTKPAPLLRQYVLGVAPDYSKRHELYLGTRQGDVYRSEDAGAQGSWSRVGALPARVRSFAFDPSGPTIFAGTIDGVFRSGDRGATWKASGPTGESLVAISPGYATDGTIFSGSGQDLFVSRDRGESWQKVALPATGRVEAVAVSPAYPSDGTVLVSIGGQGLYESTDHGRTFSATGADLIGSGHVIADFTNPTGTPIRFSPSYAQDRTVFAYANQDVVRSTDGGATWKVLHLPSAAQFRPNAGRLTGAGTSSGGLASTGHISKRRVALIAAAVLVGLAVVVVVVLWLLRRRRSHPTRSGPAPPDEHLS